MQQYSSLKLNRRHWLLAGAATLASCGGGGGSQSSSLPGTGGTGAGVQGTISGFGSVIVNGTKFDDRTAATYLNGSLSSSTDLRIGMVATINGSVDSATATGTANRIDVWSIASGVLQRPPTSGSAAFQIHNMQFTTDVSTTYEGITGLATLASGMFVTVWGIQISADGTNWLATRVKYLGNSAVGPNVATGIYRPGASTLNGMSLGITPLTEFSNGQLIRVETALVNGILNNSSATAIGAERQLSLTGKIEIEGAVTSVTDGNHFVLGTIPVDAGSASRSGNNQTIATGTLLKISGTMSGGILTAQEIQIQTTNNAMTVDITGTVEAFNSSSDFTVRGQKCDASTATVQTGSLSNLRIGVKVHLTGLSSGDEVLLVQTIGVDVV